MPLSQIYDRLTPIVRDVFDDESLIATPDLHADAVEGWDSFAHLRLILSAERAFDVAFTAEEIVKLRNLGDLASLIAAKSPS
jgi:acyl carrier protein